MREDVSPKGAAWKPHFYSVRDADGNRDDRIEKFFGVIENDASMAVEALVNDGFPLADEHRAALGAFIAAQLVRGPYFRSWVEATLLTPRREHGLKGPWPTEDQAGPDDAIVADPDDPNVPRIAPRAALDLMLGSYHELAPRTIARPWQLHRFKEPALFTGDQPATPWGPSLARGEPVSLMSAFEIRLPLDPSNVLVLGPTEGPRASETVVERDDLLDAHVGNFKLADWCEEWLYDSPGGRLRDGVKLYYWRWHNKLRGRDGEIRTSIQIGRNEPCPCGSGKKFKKCHID